MLVLSNEKIDVCFVFPNLFCYSVAIKLTCCSGNDGWALTILRFCEVVTFAQGLAVVECLPNFGRNLKMVKNCKPLKLEREAF